MVLNGGNCGKNTNAGDDGKLGRMVKNKCFANSEEISQEWSESEVHISRRTTLATAGDELPQPSSPLPSLFCTEDSDRSASSWPEIIWTGMWNSYPE